MWVDKDMYHWINVHMQSISCIVLTFPLFTNEAENVSKLKLENDVALKYIDRREGDFSI